MIRKEEEKRRERETKTKRRKTTTISQRKRKEAKKAILAQKNPFSVFKNDDEEDDMDDRFSQILPPVITSLKAHFHDYQQLKQWKVSI